MRVVLTIVAAAVLASGCVDLKYRTEAASPRLLAEITTKTDTLATLADGRQLRMNPPRDFGDALCGDAGCVRKSDIATFEYPDDRVNPAMMVLGTVVAVPVLASWVGMAGFCYATNYISHCASPPSSTSPPSLSPPSPLTRATPEQVARQWIDGLTITDGLVNARNPRINPCMASYVGNPTPTYANDAEALESVWQTRLQRSGWCLSEAAELFRLAPGEEARDRAMRLWALSQVKMRWDSGRCAIDKRTWTPAEWDPLTAPIGPPESYDLAPRKGDVRLLRLIEETLADPAAYSEDAPQGCAAGVRPKVEWPAILARLKTLGPFAPQPPGSYAGGGW